MKYSQLTVFLMFFVIGCSDSDESKVVDNVGNDGNDSAHVATDSITEVEKAPLFDMHPEPEFVLPDEMVILDPNVKYLEGKIGNEPIIMLLEKDYRDKWMGKYLYVNNGAMFDVESNMLPKNDSISIVRKKEGLIREKFVSVYNAEDESYQGVWIKEEDSLAFEMKEKSNSAEERQIFIALSEEAFHNTREGLICDEELSFMEIPSFNNFSSSMTRGSAFDFGEEWERDNEMLYVENDLIRYVKVTCNNGTGTDFVEGKEPTGPEDDSYEVAGTFYNSHNTIAYQLIRDGISKEYEIVFDEDKNARSWILGDYIIFELEEAEKEAGFVRYKWNKLIEDYELIP